MKSENSRAINNHYPHSVILHNHNWSSKDAKVARYISRYISEDVPFKICIKLHSSTRTLQHARKCLLVSSELSLIVVTRLSWSLGFWSTNPFIRAIWENNIFSATSLSVSWSIASLYLFYTSVKPSTRQVNQLINMRYTLHNNLSWIPLKLMRHGVVITK